MKMFLLTLALLSAHAVAQEGNLSEIPIFLTATGSVDDSEILHTNVAGSAATPVHLEDDTYARSRMIPLSGLKIAAFSRGVSLFPISWNTQGQPYYDPESVAWTFLVFGVSSGTEGGNASWYPASPERHLYAYQHGVQLPDHLVDRVHLIRDGDAMGVSAIRGCDSYVYNRLLGPDTGDEVDLEIYFSLDPTTITTGYLASQIYKMTYTAATDRWSEIECHKTFTELGIDRNAVIDGLCVDADNGYVLLSLANAELPDELRLYVPETNDTAAYAGPLLLATGALFVEDKLDFIYFDDGITGICADDPRLPNDTGNLPPDPRHIHRIRTTSYPQPDKIQDPSASAAISFSAHRVYKKVNGERKDYYQLNASLVANPFQGPLRPSYSVEFQTLEKNEWQTFRTKTLPGVFGTRRSGKTAVDVASPPFQRPIKGEAVPVRVVVVHPMTQARVPSFSHAFWR